MGVAPVPVGAAVGAAVGVGVAVGAASTVIRPRMSVGWNVQWYAKTPGEGNVCEKLLPLMRLPESNPPAGGQVENESSHSVTVWKPDTLFHVTVSPAVTVDSHTTPECETSQKYRFPASMETVSACVGDDTASMAAMEITVTPASEQNDRRKFHLLHK